MRAAVDDVHHRDRQSECVRATDIAVERNPEIICCSLRHCEGDAENGICPQTRLVLRTVKGYHLAVDGPLVKG